MMGSRDSDALFEQLVRLERECRRWRRLGVATVVIATGFVMSGAATRGPESTQGEVKLERLLIQNKDDDQNGILLNVQDGRPSLTFYQGGQEKLALVVTEAGSPMFSLTEAGRPRFVVGLGRNGNPVLNLHDENLKRRVSMGIFPTVGPMMSILDENGKILSKNP